MKNIPYERIIAWSAGPIAILAGTLATLLAKWFGPKFGGDETAKAIAEVLTFAVGAGVTYLAHSKWMTNLTRWWAHEEVKAPPVPAKPADTPLAGIVASSFPLESATAPDGDPEFDEDDEEVIDEDEPSGTPAH